MEIVLGISGLADSDRNRGNLDRLWPSLYLIVVNQEKNLQWRYLWYKSHNDCRYGDLNQVWVAVKWGGGGRCTSFIVDRKDFVWNLLEMGLRNGEGSIKN